MEILAEDDRIFCPRLHREGVMLLGSVLFLGEGLSEINKEDTPYAESRGRKTNSFRIIEEEVQRQREINFFI